MGASTTGHVREGRGAPGRPTTGRRGDAGRWTGRIALATAASVVGLVVWLTLTPPAPVLPRSAPVDPLPPLPENVVLFWLDPETPVYFVTGPVRTVERGSP